MTAQPRFAILEHDWPARHWDLFLEAADGLRSWRLLADPRLHAIIDAEGAAPHRALYLDYEGPVSGGRGTVTAIDRGHFEYLRDDAERIAVRLFGTLFRRDFELVSTENRLQFRWLN